MSKAHRNAIALHHIREAKALARGLAPGEGKLYSDGTGNEPYIAYKTPEGIPYILDNGWQMRVSDCTVEYEGIPYRAKLATEKTND